MKIVLTEPAKKDLRALDKTVQKRIGEAIDRLMTCPQAADFKKMKGTLDRWRLRVGDYRIIFRVEEQAGEEVFFALRVKHRREVYR